MITSDRHEMQLIVYAEIEQLSPLHSLSGMPANGKRFNFNKVQPRLLMMLQVSDQPYGSAVESIHELRMVIDWNRREIVHMQPF